MRNLKRALSLGLASAMVLGTMAFSASAATNTDITPNVVTTAFGDNDSINIDNMNSVYIAEYIGLMNGYEDGTFKPETTVTRIQMAVICVNMLHGIDFAQENYDNDTGITHFSDVADWAKSYASAAHSAGIVTGRDATTFDPDSPVTAAEALLMIQKTLGYFQDPAEFGTNWKDATTRKADSLGLYKTGTYSQDTALTREQVAAIAVYALTDCVAVSYNDSSKTYHNASSGYSINNLPQNEIVEDTLGYNNFNKLKVEDSIDSFSRPTELWSMAGREIANFVVDVHTDSTGADMEYTYSKTKKELATELKSYTSEETHEFGIFVDGMEYSEWMYAYGHTKEKLPATTDIEGFFAVMDTQNDGDFLPSNNGVLTQVFVTDEVKYVDGQLNEQGHKGKVYVTCVNTYLGEVRDVIDHETGEYTTTISFFDNVLQNSKQEDTGLVLPYLSAREGLDGEFEVDDIVIVQASAQDLTAKSVSGDGIDGEMTLVTVNTPETVTGFVTESTLTADYVGGLSLKIDDVAFEYSIGSRGEIVYENEMTPSVDTELTAYFDANVGPDGFGYILGYEAVEAAPQYLYVEESDGEGWNFTTGSTARVTFADGQEKIIEISHIDGKEVSTVNYDTIPTGSRFLDDAGNIVSANENFKVDSTSGVNVNLVENRVFGWEYYADSDTYNITTTIQDEFNYDDSKSDLGVSKGGLLATSVGGAPYDANTKEYDDRSYSQFGTLEYFAGTDGLTNYGSPVKDTMAIFSSVYMPGDTDKSAKYGTQVRETTDGETSDFRHVTYNDVAAVPGNEIGEGSGIYWNFNLVAERPTAWAVQSGATDTTLQYANSSEEMESEQHATIDGTFGSYDHVFDINSNTVIVDVVNGTIWNGIFDEEFEDLNDGTLNMQVVFGNDGVASVIFINNGVADPVGEGDYFILMDDTCKEYTEDGVKYYDYNVYVDGVATVLTAKNSQIEVTNDYNHIFAEQEDLVEKLQINTLYLVSEEDTDGYIRTVDLKYDYSPILNVRYDGDDQQDDYNAPKKTTYGTDGYLAGTYVPDDIYNNLWSVAAVATGGLLRLEHDDQFVNRDGDYDAGIFDADGIPGEDVFSYDSGTVFVVVSANKDGEVDSVRAGSVDDIVTYDASKTNRAHTWVDVVVADFSTKNQNTVTPYAELVVIVKPWELSASAEEEKLDSDVDFDVALQDPNDGAGVSSNPWELEVTYYEGVLPAYTETDDWEALRQEAIEAYKDKYMGSSSLTVEIDVIENSNTEEDDAYTIWAVSKYSATTGTYYGTEYYTITNEDFTAHDDYVAMHNSDGDIGGALTNMTLFESASLETTHEIYPYMTVSAALNTLNTDDNKTVIGNMGDNLLLAVSKGRSSNYVKLTKTAAGNAVVYKTVAELMAMPLSELFATYETSDSSSLVDLVKFSVDYSGGKGVFDETIANVTYGATASGETLEEATESGDVYNYYGKYDETGEKAHTFWVTLTFNGGELICYSSQYPASITFVNNTGAVEGSNNVGTLEGSTYTLANDNDRTLVGETLIGNYAGGKTAKFEVVKSTSSDSSYALNGRSSGTMDTTTLVSSLFDDLNTDFVVVNGYLYIDGVEEGDGTSVFNSSDYDYNAVNSMPAIYTDKVLSLVELPLGIDVTTSGNHDFINSGDESWILTTEKAQYIAYYTSKAAYLTDAEIAFETYSAGSDFHALVESGVGVTTSPVYKDTDAALDFDDLDGLTKLAYAGKVVTQSNVLLSYGGKSFGEGIACYIEDGTEISVSSKNKLGVRWRYSANGTESYKGYILYAGEDATDWTYEIAVDGKYTDLNNHNGSAPA